MRRQATATGRLQEAGWAARPRGFWNPMPGRSPPDRAALPDVRFGIEMGIVLALAVRPLREPVVLAIVANLLPPPLQPDLQSQAHDKPDEKRKGTVLRHATSSRVYLATLRYSTPSSWKRNVWTSTSSEILSASGVPPP